MAVFNGVDTEGVDAELASFVAEATPKNLSSGMSITSRCAPICGRARAIELSERVRPILDGLYPHWRDENAEDQNFEFGQVRDACQRLRAQIASRQTIDAMLVGRDASPQLAANQFHPQVWTAASAQWSTGHRHEAVLAAAKAINSMLQAKLGRRDVSEVNLVQEAFASGDPKQGKPRLRFPMIEDEKTRESMTQGALSFGIGCFQAIRNPVGHLPNDEHELSEQEALERLAALSLLARWIEQAEVVT